MNTTSSAVPTKSQTSAPAHPAPAADNQAMLPAVNVTEDSAGITLIADMPGVPKDKLMLQVEADTLTIEGEVRIETPEGLDATHVEVGLPRYRRVFTLSKELDSDKVSAEFNQGVLKLRIPKAAHAQPKKVEIKVM